VFRLEKMKENTWPHRSKHTARLTRPVTTPPDGSRAQQLREKPRHRERREGDRMPKARKHAMVADN